MRASLITFSVLSVFLFTACGAQPQNNCEGFCVVENFDNREEGSINNQGNWVANTEGELNGALVTATPPTGFTGNALMSDAAGIPFRGNSYKPLADQAIADGAIGTLFFQVSAEDLDNTYSHFGLTDIATPRITDENTGVLTIYTDFEVQMSLDHGRMRVRNGDTNSHLTNITVESGVVYSVWMVVDNLTDTWEIYVQGGAQTEPTQGVVDSTTTFPFRHGTGEALQTLYLINSPDNVDIGRTFIDNIYMDNTGENVTVPARITSP